MAKTMTKPIPPTSPVSSSVPDWVLEGITRKAGSLHISKSMYIKYVLEEWIRNDSKIVIEEK